MSQMMVFAGEELPVGAEVSDELATAIAGGQPVVLTWRGAPVGVLIDVDSYQECCALVEADGDPTAA